MPFPKNVPEILRCTLLLVLGSLVAPGQDDASKQSSPAQDKQTTISVTVTDKENRVVKDLKAADFVIYQDGRPHQVTSATLSDVPPCIGILVDNSGSMRHTLPKVASAILDFVKAGNPDDAMFLVNFNDLPYMDADFTKNPEVIREALHRADARGGTALYDAVIAAGDHLLKRTICLKRFLLVITDGDDNSSRKSLQAAIHASQHAGVTVYAIGLPYDNASGAPRMRAQHALQALTLQTGGDTLFVDKATDTSQALLKLAEQIRNQYSITYVQKNGAPNGSQDSGVKVVATGRPGLVVRMIGSSVTFQPPDSK